MSGASFIRELKSNVGQYLYVSPNWPSHFSFKKVLLGVASTATAYWIWKTVYRLYFSPLLKIPGLCYGPLYGNLLESMEGNSMDSSVRWVETHGNIVRFYHFLGQERVLVAGTEEMRHILVSNSTNYPRPINDFGALLDLVPEGLVGLEGALHRSERKLLNPSFNMKSLDIMRPLIEEKIVELMEKVSSILGENEEKPTLINVQALIKAIALDIIGKVAFEHDLKALNQYDQIGGDIDKDPVAALALVTELSNPSLLNSLPFGTYLPTKRNRMFFKAVATVDRLCEKLLAQLEQDTDDGNPDRNIMKQLMSARYKDSNGAGLSKKALRDHFFTFIFAGHETTAMVLTWLFYEFSMKPSVLAQLQKELQSIPRQGNGLLQSNSVLNHAPFLDACIKEILRLYPAAPSVIRTTLHDDVISGYTIPAGTRVIVHMGCLMRTYCDDALTYRPSRFLEPEAKSIPWYPFGLGPHACIGNKLAVNELKLLAANFLARFSVSLPDPAPTIQRKYRGGVLRAIPDIKLIVSA